MRLPADYRNHGVGARTAAWAMDLLVAPFAGLPDREFSRAGEPPGPGGSILLIRPDHAGDLLLATPAIRALRLARPEARIDLLASPWGAPAVRDNPDLDEVRTIEASWFEPGRREGPDPAGLLGAIAGLRGQRYGEAADLRGDFRSILIARATGARRRSGFSGVGLERLLTDRVPLDPRLDHVARNHAIVRLLGAGPLGPRRPVFVVPGEAMLAAERLLADVPADRALVAVFPGTNRPSASWGAERFGEACRRLARLHPVTFVLGGREADRGAAGRVRAVLGTSEIEVRDLTGRTDFSEAAALLHACDAALANDSGAAHLAVAVGTPVVALFGPTDPATLWTWDDPARFVALAGPSGCRRPCFRGACGGDHGYAGIDPEQVARALDRLIAAGRGSGA